jgi:hypothetical protein
MSLRQCVREATRETDAITTRIRDSRGGAFPRLPRGRTVFPPNGKGRLLTVPVQYDNMVAATHTTKVEIFSRRIFIASRMDR